MIEHNCCYKTKEQLKKLNDMWVIKLTAMRNEGPIYMYTIISHCPWCGERLAHEMKDETLI